MFANFLIGLREGLEASLVVSILVAFLVRTGRRASLPAAWTGVAAAAAVSLGIGALLTYGPRGLSSQAQELLGGLLSLLAVALITWMIFWMGRTARFLRPHLEGRLDAAITDGHIAVFVLALLAVGREGLETALFLWSGAQASTDAGAGPLLGAALGLSSAIALGYLMYRGALRVNLRRFFAWTGASLIVIAAGVLAYGVHDLQEAGVLPGVGDLAFNVSATIPPSSWFGTALKGVFNFSPATTWLQLLGWSAYLLPTLWLYVRTLRVRPQAKAQSRVPAAS